MLVNGQAIDMKMTMAVGGKTQMQQRLYEMLKNMPSMQGMTPGQMLGAAPVRYAGARPTRTAQHPRSAQTSFLNDTQERWADAFGAVLAVGPYFYIEAAPIRRAWLEAHYTELAKHDTPKGRKAAKVVAHRVMAALGDDEPVVIDWNFGKTVTGRMSSASPSYTNIFRKLKGTTPSQVITDELPSG